MMRVRALGAILLRQIQPAGPVKLHGAFREEGVISSEVSFLVLCCLDLRDCCFSNEEVTCALGYDCHEDSSS